MQDIPVLKNRDEAEEYLALDLPPEEKDEKSSKKEHFIAMAFFILSTVVLTVSLIIFRELYLMILLNINDGYTLFLMAIVVGPLYSIPSLAVSSFTIGLIGAMQQHRESKSIFWYLGLMVSIMSLIIGVLTFFGPSIALLLVLI